MKLTVANILYLDYNRLRFIVETMKSCLMANAARELGVVSMATTMVCPALSLIGYSTVNLFYGYTAAC